MKRFLAGLLVSGFLLAFVSGSYAADTGTITVRVTIQKISVSLTGASEWNMGIITAGSEPSTAQDFFKATNDGNVPEKLTLTVSAPAGWTHADEKGVDTFAMQYQTVDSPQWYNISAATGAALSDATAVNYEQPFGLKFLAPTSTNVSTEQSITVTVTAEAS